MGQQAEVSLSKALCLHCSLPIGSAKVDRSSEDFCCSGCETAYQVIHSLGLERFYTLAEKSARVKSPAKVSTSGFKHFDSEDFKSTYVTSLGESLEITLFLEGVHCAACVWLIEKVQMLKGISSSRVDFPKSLVTLRYDPAQIKLSSIAEFINSIGYAPHPFAEGDAEPLRRCERRRDVRRLGVAFLCAANSMMLAVGLYGGGFSADEQSVKLLFLYVSGALSVPCVFYCAIPLYRAALSGLKRGTVHIDLPLSIGILLGFFASTINLILERENVYYDSITVLIFLILLGRFLQRSAVEKVFREGSLRSSFIDHRARRVSSDSADAEIGEVFSGSLRVGDRIEVRASEKIPVDGEIVSGEGSIDSSVLTGESKPKWVRAGEVVFAGTKLTSGVIQVKATKTAGETRIGKIISEVEQAFSRRAPIEQLTDKTSRVFVVLVLALAALTALYWYQLSFELALDNTLALLVITCPCALGLATPVAFTVSLQRAAKAGILIKGAEIIERVTKIDSIVFDKTGTLTRGEPRVLGVWIRNSGGEFEEFRPEATPLSSLSEIFTAIVELERGVSHPAATALREFASAALEGTKFDDLKAVPLTQRDVIPGQGVSAKLSGVNWCIGSRSFIESLGNVIHNDLLKEVSKLDSQALSVVLLSRNGEIVAIFGLGDVLFDFSAQVLEYFRKEEIDLFLLSGDGPGPTQKVAEGLGFQKSNWVSLCSPEEKLSFVSKLGSTRSVAMVGDGANDMGALKAASIGVGVEGGAEACLRAADIFLTERGVKLLPILFEGAGRSMRIVKGNLIISFMYNLVGGTLAVCGLVNPLIAAILMPISSLTVVSRSILCRSF